MQAAVGLSYLEDLWQQSLKATKCGKNITKTHSELIQISEPWPQDVMDHHEPAQAK
jgi:hypothetical protein